MALNGGKRNSIVNEPDVTIKLLEKNKSISVIQIVRDDSNKKRGVKEPKAFRYNGIIYGILAAIMFSGSLFVTKILTKKDYHPFNIAWWRYLGTTLVAPFFLLYYSKFKKPNPNIFSSIWPLNPSTLKIVLLVIVRSMMTATVSTLQIISLKYLTQADAAAISYSTPIAVGILARIFLHERFGIVSFLLGVLAFLGVCVLARPPLLTGQAAFDTGNLIGVGFAFSTMLGISSIFVITRKLKTVHFTILLTAIGYVSTVICATLAIGFRVIDIPQSVDDCLLAITSAALFCTAHLCIVAALQLEGAGLISLVRTGDVVFAFLWQMIVGVYPDIFSLVGGAIVIFAITSSALLKWIETLPKEDTRRRNLRLCLK